MNIISYYKNKFPGKINEGFSCQEVFIFLKLLHKPFHPWKNFREPHGQKLWGFLFFKGLSPVLPNLNKNVVLFTKNFSSELATSFINRDLTGTKPAFNLYDNRFPDKATKVFPFNTYEERFLRRCLGCVPRHGGRVPS